MRKNPWKWWIVTIINKDWDAILAGYEIVKARSSKEAQGKAQRQARAAERKAMKLRGKCVLLWVTAGQVFGPFDRKPECAWQDNLNPR